RRGTWGCRRPGTGRARARSAEWSPAPRPRLRPALRWDPAGCARRSGGAGAPASRTQGRGSAPELVVGDESAGGGIKARHGVPAFSPSVRTDDDGACTLFTLHDERSKSGSTPGGKHRGISALRLRRGAALADDLDVAARAQQGFPDLLFVHGGRVG